MSSPCRFVHRRAPRALRALSWTHAAHPPHEPPRRLLPRHLTRRRRLRDLPRRRRPALVPRPPEDLRRAVPVDTARALPDDDALPPRPPQHATRALARAAAPAGNLRAGFQRPPRTLRAPLRRPLLRPLDRRRALSLDGLPLRRREPRTRRALRLGGRLAMVVQPRSRSGRRRRRFRVRACGRRTSRPRPRKRRPERARAHGHGPPREPRRAPAAARGRRARA